ncbi:class I SAM-dependent methyltransferase [Candidatus Pacearchaeota archaeon]|nr:class I SAM-dependent methyltransferase [Candidatus Pacearchaeota archaeon]
MSIPKFYNSSRAEAREEFFRSRIEGSYDINEFFFKLIFENTQEGDRILDIGTGDAFVLEQLARRYTNRYSELCGLDNSEEMLSKARGRVKGLPIAVVLGDNFNLPFQSNYFNAVTAKNVTNFSESEVYRVLRKGGMFFFREYGQGKGLIEIADLFRGRLIRAREPSFYINRLEAVGFKNLLLKELFIKRSYSLEDILKIINMFPFLDEVRNEDVNAIKNYFKGRDRVDITSDPIIITGRK